MDPMLYSVVMEGKVEMLPRFDASQLELQQAPTENTALHVAAQFGHLGCVEEMLKKCPRLLTRTNVKGETALHIAARRGSTDIVKALIDCAKQSSGEGGAEETKETLLRATNKDNDTALHMAVRKPKPRSRTTTTSTDSQAREPRGEDYREVVRMLTREDREFRHPPNNAQETPLYLAAERGYDEMVSDILEFSNSPAYTGPGRTALHAALLSGCKGKSNREEYGIGFFTKLGASNLRPLW